VCLRRHLTRRVAFPALFGTMITEDALADTRPVGELTLSEMRALDDTRVRMDVALRRIGEIEVERSRLVNTITALEGESETILAGVAERLGISTGTEWVVNRDGSVHLVSS
jgi:hypothetical protein